MIAAHLDSAITARLAGCRMGHERAIGGDQLARIVVIEDDLTFLELLRVHLSSAGHSVEVAEDAAVGLRAIVLSPPDLVVLDLNVPYLHGFEVLEALRSDPLTRSIPVVIITGRDDEQTYNEARRIGADSFLTKPVQREALMDAVTSCLSAASERPKLD
jgi:DNA-binding response OmpR family regulator